MFVQEVGPDGKFLSAAICTPCTGRGYVLPAEPYSCHFCPSPNQTYVDKACACDTGTTLVTQWESSLCFADAVVQSFRNKYPEQAAASITYKMVVTGTSGGAAATATTVLSDTFTRSFTSAALQCQEQSNGTACQAVGNLCVLDLYDVNSEACKFFADTARQRTVVNSISQWSAHMPWLYFSTDTQATTGTVATSVSFNPAKASTTVSSRVRLVMGTYSLRGKWLGFTNLTDTFQLCPPDPKQSENFLFFGHRYEQSCNLDLLPFLQGSVGEPLFYDIYLQDQGNALVPVKIRLRDYTTNNVKVNINSNSVDDIFVRRFFLYDNVGGKRDATSAPQVVRVASSLRVLITLDKSRGQSMYPPVVEIGYTDHLATDIVNYARPAIGILAPTAKNPSVATPTIRFTIEYTGSVSGFLNTMLFLFITLMILVFLAAIFKLFFLIRRTQSAAIDMVFMFKMLVFFAEVFGRVFFWLLVGISFYWFIFFKWEDAVHVLLPTEADSRPFGSLLIACFATMFVHIIHVIYNQCRSDVFFMDWEKSRGRLQGKGTDQGESVSVTVWRTVLCANEFNELATFRHLSFEVTILAVLFFLDGLGLKQYAGSQPNGRTTATTHFVLEFAIATFFWLAIAFAQYLIKFPIIYRWFEDPLNNFVDLLSVSNISVLILKERFYGFYLHGRCVHAHADVDLAEMRQNLTREAENKVSRRGLLVSDETALQTYEVYLTSELRQEYDSRFGSLMHESVTKNRAAAREAAGGQGLFRARMQDPRAQAKLIPERMVSAYASLNAFLCGFIGAVQSETGEAQVLEKTFVDKAFGLPPDMSQLRHAQFFRDTSMAWTQQLFAGYEMDFLIFNVLTFGVVNYGMSGQAGGTFIAALVTYLLQEVLIYARNFYGENNLAEKTLVDQRFLI